MLNLHTHTYTFLKLLKRPVICWRCNSKFLIEPNLTKGKCPKCKEINDIVLTADELLEELKYNVITVKCDVCGRILLTRKESEYLICANCKSTILIEKDILLKVPEEYNNLTKQEYYLLLAKEKAMNPYLFDDDSPYHLDMNFDFDKEKKAANFVGKIAGIKTFDGGEGHLFKTVKENEMKLRKK